MRKNSIKNTRVNTEVMHELSNILRGGIKDPRVAEFTSAEVVSVGADLWKTCKVRRISVLGDEAQAERAIWTSECRGIYSQSELQKSAESS